MSEKKRLVFGEGTEGQPLEDRALKEAARLFGEELMPLLGIREKVKRIAPTEQVYLNPHDFMEDFNYEMEDGRWTHLEFESDSIRTKDLRRFRSYEAIMSYNYEVDVTTCVVCSSDVRRLKNSLETGISTYRVKILRMKDGDANEVIQKLEQEQKNRRLGRPDLLQILLTPLMGGKMPQQERITRGFQLLRGERDYQEKEELACMEAVLYTLAMKFLKRPQLEKIKEMMNMTILGEMIMQDGIEKGRREGRREGRKEGMREGRKEGRQEGRKEGENQINQLNTVLIKLNRLDDLKRATQDRAYQKKLMAELLPEVARKTL